MSLADIAAAVNATLCGDGSIQITGAAPIESAGSSDISFVANPRYAKFVATTGAGALVLDMQSDCSRIPVIRHRNPYLIFAKVIDLLYAEPVLVEPGISPQAIVENGASIADGCAVGALCHVGRGAKIGEGTKLVSSVYVGRDVTIGRNCLIHPGVRILHRTKIGDNVIIHSGAVIGSDGFGFAHSEAGHKKIRQIGWVEIGSDVEIGANTTIDRGALGPTRIGRGTKIDNLVQIAHNVEIGEHCLIVSQVGISGSTKLGNYVVLAGQVGLVGHIELGAGVQVGAQSGVSHSIPAGEKYFGYPAREIMESKRIEAALRRLPELLKRVKKLESER
ncbi:UDP-3-O-(3-hydroxymyristoyl)glucosamine N-acyltransferase [candidate division GN15 bacterium]|uniref:UDP-3-O-acylglucosamine N-acyltransferase n=1 Tax=candidate division GN15 bacterium TaxID=2072418 RepID=A0A855X5R4_9BACT|nr:MAG: UDP-3-O-(3-hydroxymyristoyl)glucosamine N-acyltransferase [candidate division GN15 bacterium]